MAKKVYRIGDVVNINDVNTIKNELFRIEMPNPYDHIKWEQTKKAIKKRVTFQIVSL